MSAKALEMEDKEKNYKYIRTCLDHRRSFTPMVYSADGIPGREAIAAQQRLALQLSNNMKR